MRQPTPATAPLPAPARSGSPSPACPAGSHISAISASRSRGGAPGRFLVGGKSITALCTKTFTRWDARRTSEKGLSLKQLTIDQGEPTMRFIPMTVFAALCLIVPNAFAKGPCDLLTPSEASAILGAATKPGTPRGTVACIFSVTSHEDMSVVVLDGLGDHTASSFELTLTKSATRTPISGLGERAYYEVSDGNHGIIRILTNKAIVMLEARGGRKEGLQDALVNAAKKVLSRM